MRNIFLDLGTHYGQGLREFMQRFGMNEQWIIHTFEANPTTYGIFVNSYLPLTPWVVHHNEAISDHDGTITVNLETPPNEGDTGMGSSVIPLDKWDPWGLNTSKNHFKIQKEVPCIDFSKFIKQNFERGDNIIVKMDIEGSEYDTLQKMIDDSTIEYINHISVEWHSRFFINKNEIEEREKRIIDTLQKYDLTLESWR